MHAAASRQGAAGMDAPLTDARIRADWLRQRPMIEFIAAQPDGRYLVCEDAEGPIGYARVVRFGAMEQLTELMVAPAHQGQGVGRALLERCWPGDPTPQLGRVVVATGAPNDLTLYTEFGVMPVGGHWHMRALAGDYLYRRSQETDAPIPAVHVLGPDHAVQEWRRLEPDAIAHDREVLHHFFARDRTWTVLVRRSVDDPFGVVIHEEVVVDEKRAQARVEEVATEIRSGTIAWAPP